MASKNCQTLKLYAGKDQIVLEYQVGRPIQWGAFTSTATNASTAKGFTSPENGVLFKITVTSRKDVTAFSFFPTDRGR